MNYYFVIHLFHFLRIKFLLNKKHQKIEYNSRAKETMTVSQLIMLLYWHQAIDNKAYY